MEIVIPFLSLGLFLAFIAFLGYGIAQIRAGQRMVTLPGFLATYLHAAMLAALLIFAIGTASLINAGLSRWVGEEFSYGRHSSGGPIETGVADAPPRPGPGSEADGQEFEVARLDEAYRSGLARGIALGVLGLLLYAVHQVVWITIRPGDGQGPVRMEFLAVALVVFGLSGIVMIPMAIVSVLDYAFEASGDYFDGPGEVASMAMAFAPVWTGMLIALVRCRVRPR